MAAIRAGMKLWTDSTCVRFKPRTNERNYAHFYIGGGCSSYVGPVGGRQMISLARGCWQQSIVSHEIGHCLGFYHEQSRPDRDNYVEIIWANIPQGTTAPVTPGPVTPAPPTPRPPTCVDKDNRCTYWTSYCNSNNYVKTNCLRTCGRCGGGCK
ncbi:Zinc metalloproteinase nas-30 [Exaiptasia diaphana]|nr:Zinc metalloproteinase nas-30 [Exaiptasia diaphana]